jgi:hypothetical protein
MSGTLPVTALAISSAVVCGTALALLARLKLTLARRELFGGPTPDGALRVWALNLAFVPLMFFAGLLCDFWGLRPVMLFGSAILAVSLFALAGTPTFARAVAAVLGAALGASCLATASLVLMPHALFGEDETTASLLVGTVFFALGALVASTLADVLFRTIDQRRALAVLAFLCLVPAFFAPLIEAPYLDFAASNAPRLALFGGLDVWLAALVFFFYAPLEAAISLWAATYLTTDEEGRPRGRWILPSFWALLLSSRLLAGLAGHAGLWGDGNAGWLLVLPALLTAVALGNLAGVSKGGGLSVLVIGFVLGPILPTLLAMLFLCPTLKHTHAPGLACGALFAAGSAGSALFAPLLAPRPEQRPLHVAVRWPLALSLLVLVAAVAFALVA